MLLSSSSSKSRVFVSYDHSEDAHYKRLLEAWEANPNFDFGFDQRSPSVAINSTEAGPIKTALTKKLKEADVLLVLVGAKTKDSDWVNWEIARAKADEIGLKLKLAAVKLSSSNSSPAGLINAGTAWATSFKRDAILDALKAAKVGY